MERKHEKPALLVIKALEEEEGEQKEAEYPTIYYRFYKLQDIPIMEEHAIIKNYFIEDQLMANKYIYGLL